MISLPHLLLIGLGGGLGAVARALLAEWVQTGRLPWGTIMANITGSLIIGVVLARLQPDAENATHWQAFLAIGFCGGFTTFSSFSWQTLEQLRQGQAGLALAHVLLSVVICVVATWVGWRLGKI